MGTTTISSNFDFNPTDSELLTPTASTLDKEVKDLALKHLDSPMSTSSDSTPPRAMSVSPPCLRRLVRREESKDEFASLRKPKQKTSRRKRGSTVKNITRELFASPPAVIARNIFVGANSGKHGWNGVDKKRPELENHELKDITLNELKQFAKQAANIGDLKAAIDTLVSRGIKPTLKISKGVHHELHFDVVLEQGEVGKKTWHINLRHGSDGSLSINPLIPPTNEKRVGT